jgi:hypothetical protein
LLGKWWPWWCLGMVSLGWSVDLTHLLPCRWLESQLGWSGHQFAYEHSLLFRPWSEMIGPPSAATHRLGLKA